mmetsp:Transcript_7663/g.31117  ORF Transcript_7663/g.31117 Transcript_7663/m.31117 type:complete len:207 (+) Transcript_7663:2462-3082(+)
MRWPGRSCWKPRHTCGARMQTLPPSTSLRRTPSETLLAAPARLPADRSLSGPRRCSRCPALTWPSPGTWSPWRLPMRAWHSRKSTRAPAGKPVRSSPNTCARSSRVQPRHSMQRAHSLRTLFPSSQTSSTWAAYWRRCARPMIGWSHPGTRVHLPAQSLSVRPRCRAASLVTRTPQPRSCVRPPRARVRLPWQARPPWHCLRDELA